MRAPLPRQVARRLPIFKVFADGGTHPPVALDRPVCVIGRHDRVNLPLRAAEVSKVHALVVRDQRRVYLRDLASTNGVEVNGTLVQEAGLSDEDVIRLGKYTLRCASGFSRDANRDGDGERGGGGGGSAVDDAGDDPSLDGDESPDESPLAAADSERDAPPAELRTADARFTFPRERRTLVIGRRDGRAGCDVRLDDPSVAAVHAVLFQLDGRWHVQDLTGRGATSLNGRPIHREPLTAGDELRVGDVALRYALSDEIAGDEIAGDAIAGDGTDLDELVDDTLPDIPITADDEESIPVESGARDPVDGADGRDDSVVRAIVESSIVPAAAATVDADLDDSALKLFVDGEFGPSKASKASNKQEPPPAPAVAPAGPAAAAAPGIAPSASSLDDEDASRSPVFHGELVDSLDDFALPVAGAGDVADREIMNHLSAHDDDLIPLDDQVGEFDPAATLDEDEPADLQPTDLAPREERHGEAGSGSSSASSSSASLADQAARLVELVRQSDHDDEQARSDASSARSSSSPGESAKPIEEQISTLVEEVAEKVGELKEAWSEYQSEPAAEADEDGEARMGHRRI